MQRVTDQQMELAFKFVHDRRTGAIITEKSNCSDGETVLAMLGLLNDFIVWEYREEQAQKMARKARKYGELAR